MVRLIWNRAGSAGSLRAAPLPVIYQDSGKVYVVWQEDRSELRLFLQGMIQSAVGSYHLTNGNTTGAISQYTKALDKFEQNLPDDGLAAIAQSATQPAASSAHPPRMP